MNISLIQFAIVINRIYCVNCVHVCDFIIVSISSLQCPSDICYIFAANTDEIEASNQTNGANILSSVNTVCVNETVYSVHIQEHTCAAYIANKNIKYPSYHWDGE